MEGVGDALLSSGKERTCPGWVGLGPGLTRHRHRVSIPDVACWPGCRLGGLGPCTLVYRVRCAERAENRFAWRRSSLRGMINAFVFASAGARGVWCRRPAPSPARRQPRAGGDEPAHRREQPRPWHHLSSAQSVLAPSWAGSGLVGGGRWPGTGPERGREGSRLLAAGWGCLPSRSTASSVPRTGHWTGATGATAGTGPRCQDLEQAGRQLPGLVGRLTEPWGVGARGSGAGQPGARPRGHCHPARSVPKCFPLWG